MHRGELGTAALNRALQERLNPPRPAPPSSRRGERAFRRGDKVMQLRNDYDKSVFNGDIGVIARDRHRERHAAASTSTAASSIYERDELDQLVHAYAVSVHKSQGSEYPAVVIPLVTQHFMMLQRSLLYTAVTRGKKLVVIVGSRGGRAGGPKAERAPPLHLARRARPRRDAAVTRLALALITPTCPAAPARPRGPA